MEERTVGYRIYTYLKLCTFISIAIALFFIRDIFVEHLKYAVGALMTFYGIEEILYETLFHREHYWHRTKNYLGFVELILGIVTLIAPLEYAGVCIMWASWSIIRESYEIRELISETEARSLTIISGIESATIIVFSVMLIFEPTEHHAMIHLYLLMVELILNPLIPFNDDIYKKRKQKKNSSEESTPEEEAVEEE